MMRIDAMLGIPVAAGTTLMARLNISIPDELGERLHRQRDRINASKVCAIALERELDTMEGRTAVADPELEQLRRRLQTSRERWYQRGREDGRRWALERATRLDLWHVADELASERGEELVELARHVRGAHGIPKSFDARTYVERWRREDEGADMPPAEGAGDDPAHSGPSGQVDLAGYLEGWRDVVKEIWRAVSPSLR
jgi:hypothetical protein